MEAKRSMGHMEEVQLKNTHLMEELSPFLVGLVGSWMPLDCTTYPSKNAPFYCCTETATHNHVEF